MTFETYETLSTDDGATLALRSALPDATPKALLHINHGMAEHSARYIRFAKALVSAGYGAYAHDHRGHGYSKAPDSSPGIFAKKDGWDRVLQDVETVQRFMVDQHPDVPIVTFGHSMGSIIAFNHILRTPRSTAGAALWNSGVDTGALAALYGAILKTERFFKGSDVPSGIAKKLTFETWNKQFAPNRTDSDWLSRDEAEVDKYINDPYCGFDITIGLWLDVLSGIKFAASDPNLLKLPADLPVHLLAGTADPCSQNGSAVARIEQRMISRGMSDVTFEQLSDTRHESLNELNRDETTAKFIQWLNARFG